MIKRWCAPTPGSTTTTWCRVDCSTASRTELTPLQLSPPSTTLMSRWGFERTSILAILSIALKKQFLNYPTQASPWEAHSPYLAAPSAAHIYPTPRCLILFIFNPNILYLCFIFALSWFFTCLIFDFPHSWYFSTLSLASSYPHASPYLYPPHTGATSMSHFTTVLIFVNNKNIIGPIFTDIIVNIPV